MEGRKDEKITNLEGRERERERNIDQNLPRHGSKYFRMVTLHGSSRPIAVRQAKSGGNALAHIAPDNLNRARIKFRKHINR